RREPARARDDAARARRWGDRRQRPGAADRGRRRRGGPIGGAGPVAGGGAGSGRAPRITRIRRTSTNEDRRQQWASLPLLPYALIRADSSDSCYSWCRSPSWRYLSFFSSFLSPESSLILPSSETSTSTFLLSF